MIDYRLTHSKQYLTERFEALDDSGMEDHPRYNIAPTQQVLIVKKEQGADYGYSRSQYACAYSG